MFYRQKKGRTALCLILAVLLLLLTAACNGGHRGSLAIYAGSWLRDDAICLRLLSTTWPNGSYESCKYSCRGREDFRKKLQAAVEEADTGAEWRIKWKDGYQDLVAGNTEDEIRYALTFCDNDTALIRKYRNGELTAYYVDVFQGKNTAILSGSVGKFTDSAGETYPILFPVHLLEKPRDFETTATVTSRSNPLDRAYACLASPEEIRAYYEDLAGLRTEDGEDGFILYYDGPSPAPEPVWVLPAAFRLRQEGEKCLVTVEPLR